MNLLRRLVDGTVLRSLPGARTIQFWLDGEAWTLDPKQKQLVLAGTAARPALTIRTSPDVLMRLLTEREVYLARDEELAFEGDPLALKPVIETLSGGLSPLRTQMSALSR